MTGSSPLRAAICCGVLIAALVAGLGSAFVGLTLLLEWLDEEFGRPAAVLSFIYLAAIALGGIAGRMCFEQEREKAIRENATRERNRNRRVCALPPDRTLP